MMNTILSISFFLFCNAQNFENASIHVNKISVEEGLSSSIITDIHLSNEGKLWIGTRNGLNYFNNNKWKELAFRSNLSFNYINENSLIVDEKLGVFFASTNGIAHLKNNNWSSYTATSTLNLTNVKKLYLNDNKVWAQNGSTLLTFSEDKWNEYSEKNIVDFSFYKKKLIYVTLNNSDLHFENKIFKTGINGKILKLITSENSLFVISDDYSIYEYSSNGFILLSRSQYYITSIEKVRNTEKYFIATEKGLFVLEKGRLENIKHNFLSSAQINKIKIMYLNEASKPEYVLWIASYSGLYNYHPNSFNQVNSDYTFNDFSQFDSQLLFATNSNGIVKYTENQFIPFHLKRFKNERILSLNSSKNELWVSTPGELHHYTKGKWKAYSRLGNLILSQIIKIIFNKDYVWFMSRYNGSFLFENGIITSIKSQDVNQYNDISLWDDAKNEILVASSNGLFRVNSKTSQKIESNLFANLTAVVNKEKFIFLGTENNGVIIGKLQEDSLKFEFITALTTTNNKMKSNFIEQLLIENDKLIVKTNKNISVFSTSDYSLIRRFNAEDGVKLSNESIAFIKFSEDLLLLANSSGLNINSKKNIFQNIDTRKDFKITIVNTLSRNNNVDINDISHDNQLVATIDLQKSIHEDAILYKLISKSIKFESEWSNSNKITMPLMNSGTHDLKFLVKDYYNNLNEYKMSINVNAAFYLKWWAYIFYILVLFTLFYVLLTIRTKVLFQKNEYLEALIEERLNEIKVQNLELEQKNRRLDAIAEDLRKSNKLKNEFLGIASHDLKNPLSVIQGFSELLLEEEEIKDDNHRFMNIIHKSSNDMFKIITDLLDTAKTDDTDLKLNIANYNIDTLIKQIIDNYQIAIKKKELKLLYTLNDEILLDCDLDRIREVFDNLISNAIKYSPRGKTIWVFLNKDIVNKCIRFTIKDEGPGMTEEDLKNAFGRFKRLSAQPTAGESSSGLGLSIVKRLVELHQGKVWIESEFGKGTSFIVEIPFK